MAFALTDAGAVQLDLERDALGVCLIDQIPDDMAQRARAEHEAVGAALRDTVRHAVAAGEILLRAKARLPHGVFGDWLETQAGIPRRTAQGYMRLARELPKLPPEKRNGVALLSLRDALSELATPTGKVAKLPPPALDAALEPPFCPALGPREGESDDEYDKRLTAQALKELREFLDYLDTLPRGPDGSLLLKPKPVATEPAP